MLIPNSRSTHGGLISASNTVKRSRTWSLLGLWQISIWLSRVSSVKCWRQKLAMSGDITRIWYLKDPTCFFLVSLQIVIDLISDLIWYCYCSRADPRRQTWKILCFDPRAHPWTSNIGSACWSIQCWTVYPKKQSKLENILNLLPKFDPPWGVPQSKPFK